MKFDYVIADITKLIGKKIQSIRPGAELTIKRVSVTDKQIEIKGADGTFQTRPFEEIRKVWNLLNAVPAVHVDGALGGSGSRRNQPETILANLPYVEVVYIQGRKHLTLMGGATHPLGTFKKMDQMASHALLQKIAEANKAKPLPSLIIVTDDLRATSASLEGITGVPPQAPSPGNYIHSFGDKQILIVGLTTVAPPISLGSYVPVDTKMKPIGGIATRIAGEDYTLVVRSGINLLARSFL